MIVSQVRELSESVPELVEQYRSRIDKLNHQTAAWPFGIHERVEEGILLFEGWLKRMPEKAMGYAVKMIDFIVLIALIPFIAFYILKDFTALKKWPGI